MKGAYNMTDFIYLPLREDEDNQENVDRLKELLNKIGVDATLKGNLLTIGYQEETVKEKTTRNAGRPTLDIKEISVEEINKRIKESNAKTVAAELGISRATLFRKLQYAKDNGNDVVF